jgi:hypothetical protein
MGLFFHPSMRQSLIRAREDMAGLSNFIYRQSKKFAKLLIKILNYPIRNEKDCHNYLTTLSSGVSPGGSFPY